MTEFTKNVIMIIKSIPKGKVMTYGLIARVAGNPRGARQVSRILYSMSDKYDLPWHRVINAKGEISLYDAKKIEQISLLVSEGIVLKNEKVSLNKYLHRGNYGEL